MNARTTFVDVIVTVEGRASARAVVLTEPLSFWGGVDPTTGSVIDQHHPQLGVTLTDAIVVMPSGRGSSSASSVIAEMVRLGTSPAGFVLFGRDEIVALGAIVGDELYGVATPVVVVEAGGPVEPFRNGDTIAIDGSRVTVNPVADLGASVSE